MQKDEKNEKQIFRTSIVMKQISDFVVKLNTVCKAYRFYQFRIISETIIYSQKIRIHFRLLTMFIIVLVWNEKNTLVDVRDIKKCNANISGILQSIN